MFGSGTCMPPLARMQLCGLTASIKTAPAAIMRGGGGFRIGIVYTII